MKKIFLAITILLSTTAFSQSVWRFGIKGGANLSFSNVNLTGNKITAASRTGYFGGALIEFSPGDSDSHLKLQLEALYNCMNVEYPIKSVAIGSTKDKITIQQISVPLLMKVVIFRPLTLNIGPTFNTNIGGKKILIGEGNDGSGVSIEKKFTQDNYKSFQYGAVAGITYNIYKGLFIDARYNKQFGNVNNMKSGKIGFEELNGGKVKWDDVQVSIGFLF